MGSENLRIAGDGAAATPGSIPDGAPPFRMRPTRRYTRAMPSLYRTVHAGLGPIGAAIARAALARSDIVPVAAADPNPAIVGQRLAEVAAVESAHDVRVAGDLEEALATPADAVLQATGSYLPDVMPQLLACIRAGRNVVSTCEELAYPWLRHPALAAELDREARQAGVSVLGTGINPGFLLDALVLALSGSTGGVRCVEGYRIVDVSQRRLQLQRKVGVGLSRAEFDERLATGRFGHVGLKESAWLVAAGLGWELESLEETLEPVPGPDGKGIGIRQVARGRADGRDVITMVVQMSVGVENPRDEILVEGDPPVHLVIPGGLQGDRATAAVVLNAVAPVVDARPGLLTMLDLVPLRSSREASGG